MFPRLPRLTFATAWALLVAPVALAQPCITPGVPCPGLSNVPDCVMLLPGASDVLPLWVRPPDTSPSG